MVETVTTLTVALLVLGAATGTPHAALGADATGAVDGGGAAANATAGNATANESASIGPGARFAGAIGVQGATLSGDLESRAFQHRLERAESEDAKAGVVAERAEQSEQRLADLRAELDDLRAARANGSISYGAYAARTARIHARLNAVQRVANDTETAARGLPDEALARHGVNVSAVETLRERAANASGPEVANIARGIGGGEPDRFENRTARPFSDAENASDRAANATGRDRSDTGADATNRTVGANVTERLTDPADGTNASTSDAWTTTPGAHATTGARDPTTTEHGDGPTTTAVPTTARWD